MIRIIILISILIRKTIILDAIQRYSTPLKILSNEPFFLGNINACIEGDDVCDKLTHLVSAYIERNKYSYDKIKSEHYSQNILKLLSIGNLYTNEGEITIKKYIQDKKQEYLSSSNEWKHINLLRLAENIYFYASFYEKFTTIQEILDIIITDQDSEVKVRDDAILLLGLSSLYRCYKCNDDIEEKGIKLLDTLSNKGNKLSQMVLANYYYSKSNYKLAEKYSIKYINDRPFLDTRLAYISEHFESPEYILYEVKHCDFFCYDNYEKNKQKYGSEDKIMSVIYSQYGEYLEKGCYKNRYGVRTIERPYSKLSDCNITLVKYYLFKKDYQEALTRLQAMLRIADEYDQQPNINILLQLGNIYYQGLGLRQDLEKAKEYYGRACDLKDQEGCTLYREVNEKIR